jgi:hypothetical protein
LQQKGYQLYDQSEVLLLLFVLFHKISEIWSNGVLNLK